MWLCDDLFCDSNLHAYASITLHFKLHVFFEDGLDLVVFCRCALSAEFVVGKQRNQTFFVNFIFDNPERQGEVSSGTSVFQWKEVGSAKHLLTWSVVEPSH